MTATRTSTHTGGRPSRTGRWNRVRLAALASVGTVILAAGCASGPASAPTTTPTGSGSGGRAEIAISNFMFIPATLTVKPGTTVTVVNRDNVAHTVTASSGAFNTGSIGPGQSATFTAPKTAGSFPFICNIHQYMTGTVVVS